MSLAEARPVRAPEPAPLVRDVAVVDVGSNSVRLVQYRLEGRAIWTVFNEKVLAGLGRGVAATGRLSPEGASAALAALRRFDAVLTAGRPVEVFTAATAAVREAADGPAFVARVKDEIGLELRVLSGAEEARYAAFGVIAGAPAAEGVVGDLGGASLELTRVGDGRVGEGVTLPLGPFALGAGSGFEADRVRKEISKRLDRAARAYRSTVFHAVGGAWRNLALLHMRMTNYPLEIVHGYSLSAREALEAARLVARQSRSSLERIDGVSKKRSETLPYAALVLEGLIERLGVQRIEFSAYGVREGLLYESLADALRLQDPLLAGCEALASRHGMAADIGDALEAWACPAFAALPAVLQDGRDRVVIAAAARLADAGAKLHPDHRADLVFDQVLRAPLAGLNHPERAFLALASFARYTSAERPPNPAVISRLLTSEQVRRARAVGSALRLGAELSGRTPSLLERTRLSIDARSVALNAEPGWSDVLLTEQAGKRLNTLASVLSREAKIRI